MERFERAGVIGAERRSEPRSNPGFRTYFERAGVIGAQRSFSHGRCGREERIWN
ncbi:MAG: hypothetical protein IJS22_00655 [Lachnospiraceae bacterium]|nr:hypothetical protein [Lachnospiraceae bacterium]